MEEVRLSSVVHEDFELQPYRVLYKLVDVNTGEDTGLIISVDLPNTDEREPRIKFGRVKDRMPALYADALDVLAKFGRHIRKRFPQKEGG